MQSSLPERYPNWRQVYGALAQPPMNPDAVPGDTEQLRNQQARIASLCLSSVQQHELFVAELKAFVTQAGRDPELQQLVEDYGAYSLGVFEQNSALSLRAAIERVIDDKPQVIIKPVAPPIPQQKSFTTRLWGR
jgi:hypothetical protein